MGLRTWIIRAGFLAAAVAGGLFIHSNQPTTNVISANFGGSIAEFIEDFATLRHQRSMVRIEDVCISACTMVLGLIPLNRVCADARAVFGFHSAWFMGPFGPIFSREGTRIVWNIYPDNVKAELVKRGWDGEGKEPHPDLLYVKATEFVKECKNG